MADVKTGWQPIETAPKDGNVLIYGVVWAEVGSGSDGKPAVVEAEWIGNRWSPVIQTYYSFDAVPTHWRPLPDPPGQEKCCEGGPQWGHAWGCPKCPD